MRRSRKGSLELSVNAIVILVMAIAVLGIGLAFVRGALTGAQEKVFTAIKNSELENPASADRPATADLSTKVKNDKSAEIKLGFYNSGSSPVDVYPFLGDCVKAGTAQSVTSVFTISTGFQKVDPGVAIGFRGYVNDGATASSGENWVCTLEFRDTQGGGGNVLASTQLYITVTS
jgi:hypothetical protein